MSATKVSVLLWHQCENNLPYLQATVESLFYQENQHLFEVVCVAGTPVRPTLDPVSLPEKFQLIHMPNVVTVSEKFEIAMMHTNPDSTHTLLLSDDVICSETLVQGLYESFRGRDAIINPFSNSDCQSLYEADIEIQEPSSPVWQDKRRRLTPDMTLEDLVAWELDAIQRYPRGPHLLVPFPTLSFFCTMIPRSVWLKVGRLDPLLEHRHNDQDFCLRAQYQGIPSFVQMGTFAFHFGSRTIHQLANEESKAKASAHFRKKWEGIQL